MKKVLALVLAGLMIGSLSVSASANPNSPPPQGKPAAKQPDKSKQFGTPEWQEALHNRVVASLGLTAAQKKGINAAYAKQKAAQAKILKDYPFKAGNDAHSQKRMDAITKVSNTFTAEAKKALGAKYPTYLKKLQEEVQKEAQKMGFGTGPTQQQIESAVKAARARVVKQLGLTAAQQKSLTDIEAKAQKDTMALSRQMMGKDYSKMTKAEQDKMQASFKKIGDARNASIKKLLGEKKAAEYDKKMAAEMQKEMEKLMPKPPASNSKPKAKTS